MDKLCEIDGKELAVYIKKEYLKYEKNKDKRIISPIKLQKSLYFLFAYWGQYIRTAKENPSSVEVDYSKYNENLFCEEIEAWTYGPVLPSIYNLEKTGGLDYIDIPDFLEDDIVKKEFIDNLLLQLFEADDFGLVRLSHQDKTWKKYYIETDEIHNNVMPKEEIINEYSA